MSDVRTIRVFIASPGDLADERRAFKQVLEALNGDFAHGARVKFEPLGWEDTVSPVGRRPQSEFNAEVEKCDVFFLVLWRRWGQEVPDVTPPATSYTEEEFNVATARLSRTGKREPIIHALFKKVHTDFLADPGKQLQKVLDFKTRLAKSGEAITLSFDDEPGFRKQVDRLLRDAAHRLTAPPVAVTVVTAPVPLPEDELKAIKAELAEQRALSARLLEELEELRRPHKGKRTAKSKTNREKQKKRTSAKVVSTNNEIEKLELAERAAKAALEGRVEEARLGFTQATEGTSSLKVLYLAYDFYLRTGDLTLAESLMERSLALSGPDEETASTAAALGNLGLVYRLRGDLDRAEEMHKRSLAIDEKLGDQEGMAASYGNLGLVYRRRGDLDRAEEMHEKSLAIEVKLGRDWGMASDYGNLGLVYQARGDLDRAEKMHMKSLAIDEKLDRQEGMAASYGNIGEIHRRRGNFEEAERWLKMQLDVSERLHFLEFQANSLASLGNVAQDRGDRAQARDLWNQARELYDRMGMKPRVKELTGWLDQLPPVGT